MDSCKLLDFALRLVDLTANLSKSLCKASRPDAPPLTRTDPAAGVKMTSKQAKTKAQRRSIRCLLISVLMCHPLNDSLGEEPCGLLLSRSKA